MASRLRGLMFEPLEQRQVLTAGLTFDETTPYSIDPTTQNITIHYELSEEATAAFDVVLHGVNGQLQLIDLVTETISDPGMWSVGSHDFTFSEPFDSDPLDSYQLAIRLDPSGANQGASFTGSFLEASGILEVFGTSGGDVIDIGLESGPQIRVTHNSVDQYYDPADVEAIHVRAVAGDDQVQFSDDVDVPFWAFGGLGDDTLYGSAGETMLDGGEGNDTMYTGGGDTSFEGGSGTEDLAVAYGSDSTDVLMGLNGPLTFNNKSISLSNTEGLAAILADGNDYAWLDEVALLADGVQGLAILGGDGYDSIALGGDATSNPQTGMSIIQLFGGDDGDEIWFLTPGITRDSEAAFEISGDGGDDALHIGLTDGAFGDAAVINGGAGTNTLELTDITADTVAVHPDRIGFAGNADVAISGFASLTLDTADEDETQITIEATASAIPSVTLTGDEEDTVSLAAEPGGTIDAVHASGTTTFDVDGLVDIETSGVANFELDAQTISLDGIALNQYYDVTTDYVDPISEELVHDGHLYFTGAAVVPGGTAAGGHRVLVSNNSLAMLHGGFSDDNAIAIGGAMHDVQYLRDVSLESHSYSASIQVTTTHIVTPHDAVPRFVPLWMEEPDASDVNRSLASGDWSDEEIWSLGHVPTDGELVQIDHDATVTYDVNNDTDAIRAIEILGALVFATDIDTHLLVGTVEVLPGGLLEIGSSTTSIDASKTATLTFADQLPDINGIDPAQHGTGLLAFGAVSIHGSPVGTLGDEAGESQTWLRLAVEPLAGHDQLVLASPAPAGWNAGDTIVLPDTRQPESGWDWRLKLNTSSPVPRESESLTIYGFNEDRTIIYLDDPEEPVTFQEVAYDHKGGYSFDWNETTEEYDATLEIVPHVALLNRNVVLTSEHADGYRGHTLYGGRAEVDIQYARFKDLGRTDTYTKLGDDYTIPNTASWPEPFVVPNQIARYSAHFHHLAGPINPSNTGYQYTFVGNAMDASRKWPVAVHDSHFGFIADNVVYDAEGSGFITEAGSEIGNLFLNNITVAVYGTFSDGNAGLDPTGDQSNNDHARGGVGFWFRRTGNDIVGNVTADNTYGGIVLSSYYLSSVKTPNFRGANTHVAGEYTDTILNDPGTISDNEIYGMGWHGMWIAYTSGSNLLPNHPEVVFDNMTIWNAAINSSIFLYHVAEVTFDHLLILGDINTLTRLDSGASGISTTKYENIHMQVLNSRIEGNFNGVLSTPASGTPFGEEPVRTLIENTTLKNYRNVLAFPSTERGGNGNFLDLVDDNFTMFDTLPVAQSVNNNDKDPANIVMAFSGTGDPRNLTEYSIVRVFGYNGDSEDNFQVYYKEQAADEIMVTSGYDWYLRGERQTGAPPGTYMTNEEVLNTYGFTTAGFLAPSNATEREGIVGLVGATDEFIDPSTWDPKVVIVTPFDDAEYIRQNQYGNPFVPLRYIVEGQVPEGGATKFTLEGDGGEGSFELTEYTAPIQDGILWNTPVGTYTLRGFIVDDMGEEVAGSSTEIEFEILPEQIQDVTLAPFPVDVEDDFTTVSQLLIAAGGDYLDGKGVAIAAASAVQGNWQYRNASGQWIDVPTVSETAALVLPPSSRIRFVVDEMYTYSAMDDPPELVFYTWDQQGSSTAYTTVDITSDPDFGTTAVTVTQPLLAPINP